MTDSLHIALAQLNPVVGDIDGNVAKILAAREEAARVHAVLVVYTELVVTGYPPEDLILKPFFQDRNTREWVFDGGHKPADMKSEAPGINPSRWENV